jgi:hypothetical protein
MQHRRVVVATAAAITATFSLAAAPRPARACGGFFCDNVAPVVQSGERIVFAMDGTRVIAHIQIQYTGPAESFAWILPVHPDMPAPPRVGTDTLFTMLDAVIGPQFQTTIETIGVCAGEDDRFLPTAAGGAFDNAGSGPTATPEPDVIVRFSGEVGPFDARVLSATSVGALFEWLQMNGYAFPDTTRDLLAPYVGESYDFLALKLLKNRDAGDLRPIVLEMDASHADIPIRLTQVAAIDDMGIIAHVLGTSRAVPLNYRHFEINEARIDWLAGGSNYPSVVTEAANETGGRGFVTDYAGSSDVLRGALWNEGNDAAAASLGERSDLLDFLTTLSQIGLLGDPAVQALLEEKVDLSETEVAGGAMEVFTCPFCFDPGQLAGARFDAAELADLIEEAAVRPLREANALFADFPYLTRLYTTMSPLEMTEDPVFGVNADMGDQSNVHTATLRVLCGDRQYERFGAPINVVLTNGTIIENVGTLGAGTTAFGDGGGLVTLPSAARIDQLGEQGAGTVVEDRSTAIDATIERHNTRNGVTVRPARSIQPGSGFCGAAGGGASAMAFALVLAAGVAVAARRLRRRPVYVPGNSD